MNKFKLWIKILLSSSRCGFWSAFQQCYPLIVFPVFSWEFTSLWKSLWITYPALQWLNWMISSSLFSYATDACENKYFCIILWFFYVVLHLAYLLIFIWGIYFSAQTSIWRDIPSNVVQMYSSPSCQNGCPRFSSLNSFRLSMQFEKSCTYS